MAVFFLFVVGLIVSMELQTVQRNFPWGVVPGGNGHNRKRLSQIARFRSGDIVLFSSNREVLRHSLSSVVSCTGIKLASGSPFTHVAMVFVHPVTGIEYLWDIVASGGNGCRLRLMRPVLKQFQGKLAFRTLVRGAENVDDAVFLELMRERWRTPYTFNFVGVYLERLRVTADSDDSKAIVGAGALQEGEQDDVVRDIEQRLLSSDTESADAKAGRDPGTKDPDRRHDAARLQAPAGALSSRPPESPGKGFFCSSLIAYSLERLGVCDWRNASLPGYWPFPGDFAQDCILDNACLPGFAYGPCSELRTQ